jgi:ATPase family associated with various cellular activities (AAA)
MRSNLQLTIPQAARWLLRLAVNPVLSGSLQRDPVAFSAWYASVGTLLSWPEEVAHIQDKERAKKLSLTRMMKLLSQINYAFAGRTNAEHARAVLEGYAVHDWVSRNTEEFVSLAAKLHDGLAELHEHSGEILESLSPFATRLTELGHALKLSALEQDILSFAFLTTVSQELKGIFDQLADERWTAGVLWTTLFDTSTQELAKAMRPNSPLRLSGLLQPAGRRGQLATVSWFWVELLAAADSLAEALIETLDDKDTAGRPARLLDEDLTLAIRILKNANEPGVNLLLYGPSSLDKRRLLADIVSGSGRTAWRVRRFEEAPRDVRPSLTFAALQLLAQKSTPSMLVVERPSEVLQGNPSQMMRMLFGVEMTSDDSLPFDENLLATNPVPAVWLTSDSSSLPESTIVKFVFHAPLKKAALAEREQVIKAHLEKLRLTKAVTAQILKLDGVSSAQLQSAVKASRLIESGNKGERDRAVLQAIRRSQRALSRDLSERTKPSVTRYSLEYLNTAGRFSPQQILDSFAKRPRGSVLLYGPPGTGKTQFTEHVAAELDLPLISKSASALLSKWLGDSEKNIAAAFEEAAAEDAILFFDEGDSFLRSRELAGHSWEVTQTNELLQHMERFDGIVIVATNLFRDLDTAALRRFTFKVEFRELDLGQRWKMFLSETGLATRIEAIDLKIREEWEKRLLFMKYLTPGDFATVKRQCLVLDIELTPEGWLDQLEIECEIKSTVPRSSNAHQRERAA